MKKKHTELISFIEKITPSCEIYKHVREKYGIYMLRIEMMDPSRILR